MVIFSDFLAVEPILDPAGAAGDRQLGPASGFGASRRSAWKRQPPNHPPLARCGWDRAAWAAYLMTCLDFRTSTIASTH